MGNCCGSSKQLPDLPSTGQNQTLTNPLEVNRSLEPANESREKHRDIAYSVEPQLSIFSTGDQSNRYQARKSRFQPASVRTVSVAPSIASSYGVMDDVASLASDAFLGKISSQAGDTEITSDIPPNCRVVAELNLVDSVGNHKGTDLWRAENDEFGLILAKCVTDVDAETLTMFDNELKILCFVQNNSGKKKKKDYHFRGPFKTGYGSDVLRYQHNNVIGFIGYMEASEETRSGLTLQRRLLTEYYVDTLRDHVEHRTQNARKDMKHYEVALYAFQIATGLKDLHKMKVCHRDLNTENVIMGIGLLDRQYKEWLRFVAKEENKRKLDQFQKSSNTGRSGKHHDAHQPPSARIDYYQFLKTPPLVAKIANFGHAKRIIVGRTSTTVGSMQFMAPEMMRQEEYDHAVDVWSFGCIMYEMISAKPPFHKKPVNYIEGKVLQNKFPKQDRIGGSRFRNLEQIMRHCLRPDPSIRCRAKELVQDLGNSLVFQS